MARRLKNTPYRQQNKRKDKYYGKKCFEGDGMLKQQIINISIIIPLYRGQKYCTRLLDMIEINCLYNNLFQECEVEVIFVNDYPDEKVIFEEADRRFEVYVVNSERNLGIHASRVKGLDFSRGEYIVMLDQDDLITEDWLYSQWHKIICDKSNFCVCNGWSGRFRVLYGDGILKSRVNEINYYLTVGNPIWSPGQVIIKKKSIPQEWLENIQIYNGADDFLLWIMVLKKENKFTVNDEYLYYHTPDRSIGSVDLSGMMQSLRETVQILSTLKIIKSDEERLLNNQIKEKEGWLDVGKVKDQPNLNSQIYMKNYLKFNKMFHIMLDWMKLKNKGIGISSFCKKNNFLNVAVYGMGYIGECLYDELINSDINIIYAIDRTAIDFRHELPIFKLEDDLEPVDIVIVTAVEDIRGIINAVKEKVNCPVIAISKILLLLGIEDG